MKYKSYKKNDEHSYVFGAFPVMELIQQRPEIIIEVFISEKYNDKDNLEDLLKSKGIKYSIADKIINRIANKGNIFVVAVFKKEKGKIDDKNHIILHKPSDMGNLGTIIRSMVGFGYHDLAIISDHCDFYNPKVIRASMGAFFKINIEYFESINEYLLRFKNRELYSFMLSSKNQKSILNIRPKEKYSLIFGNEGSGLPKEFEDIGNTVLIPQYPEIDSLNLTIAAGIAMFWFENIGRSEIND